MESARPGRWDVAVGGLLPLIPGAWLAWQPSHEGTGVALLLSAVVLACWIGGATGGGAAAVLATFIFDLIILPSRFGLSAAAAPHLAGFGVGAATIVVLHWRLRARWRGTEQARDAAERRANALADRVDLLAPMLDTAPIGFALMDRELRFRYANEHFAQFTQIPVGDHLGHTPGELFGPEIGVVAEQVVARVFETGETQEAIPVAVRWEHGLRHYLSNRYPVRDQAGRMIGVGVGAIDITEKALLERHSRRVSAELTATIASSPLAVALLDPQLRIRHVNRPFQALAGDPGRTLTGFELAEVTGLPPVVHTMTVEVARTGAGASAADVPVRGDGGSPRFATVNCFPVRTDDTVVAIALFILDVTEQHRLVRLEAEAETLRATAEIALKLEQAQRLAGLGSWEVDLATGAVSWTDQMSAIVGDPEQYFRGDGEVAVHPGDAGRAARLRTDLLTDGVPFADEFRLVRRADGAVFHVYCTGEGIRDGNGRLVRAWGTFQDVTPLRRAERVAQEAQRSAAQARDQLEAEHRALQMFVRAMLPSALPEVPGSTLAAMYLPVLERVDIGGDWFDSFPLPDGRLALAVGDVTGHDLRAATMMGQVRNAVRAYAFEDPDPARVLARANMLLARVPDLDLVTMLYGVYDPTTSELLWANAGHPPPLLCHDGVATALDDPGGMILGVFADGVVYHEGALCLAPGDTVLWYTDGLVDHRTGDPDVAMRTLIRLVAETGHAPDRLLHEVTDRMLAGGVQEDDVCLLALHRAAAVEPRIGPRPEPRAGRRGGNAPRFDRLPTRPQADSPTPRRDAPEARAA